MASVSLPFRSHPSSIPCTTDNGINPGFYFPAPEMDFQSRRVNYSTQSTTVSKKEKVLQAGPIGVTFRNTDVFTGKKRDLGIMIFKKINLEQLSMSMQW